MAVNTQTPLAEVVADRRPQFVPLTDDVLRVARRYAERKHELNAMDFDDLLLNWKILLAEREPVRRALSERFQHVLVDEYQDTNRLQGDVVDLLVAGHRNLCVVGDDAQSIYSFRGAHFENILEFEKRYPDARRFDLTVNYRSTPQILALANASIAANVRQFEKELASVRRDGTLPALVPCRDVVQQAAFVAQRVLELRDEGIPLPEIAVLYRAHHHSMEIQFELARRGIPFVVRSGVRFFEAAHVKDVLAHLRFARNPGDELALKRCLKITPGVGTATAEAVWSAFAARRRGGRGTVEELLAPEVAAAGAGQGAPGLHPRWRSSCARSRGRPTDDLPGEAIEEVLDQGYEEYLRAEFLNADARIEDIQQLAQYARSYEDTEAFLAEIALLTELSAETVAEGGEPDEKMVLSSVHQAKGLEWRAVFVVWLADGRFPSAQALKDPAGEEEERRLFYVACTRAKDELYLVLPDGGRAAGPGAAGAQGLPLPGGAAGRAGAAGALAAGRAGRRRPAAGGAAARAGPARPAGRAGPVRPARRRGRGRARRRGGGDGGGEDVPF